MALYCDSNLLIRIYAELPESAQALRKLEQHRQDGGAMLPITWLHQLEIVNAFEQLVFLARNGQALRMTGEQAAVALAQFDADLSRSDVLVPAGVAPGELVTQTRQLSQRHTARHGFRAYDIAHVASALMLACDTFWSFDRKATALAKLEGLKTL